VGREKKRKEEALLEREKEIEDKHDEERAKQQELSKQERSYLDLFKLECRLVKSKAAIVPPVKVPKVGVCT
jgi:hypothetical protein